MDEKVNINRADMKNLRRIIHIGPVRALAIIEERPFRDIYELSNVRGLGKKRMEAVLEQGIAYV